MTKCFADDNVLLRCHDALYVKNLSAEDREQVNQAIKAINPFARADCQQRKTVREPEMLLSNKHY